MGALVYDGETVTPPNSAVGRGETLTLLRIVEYRLMTVPETVEIAETLVIGAGVSAWNRRKAELLKDEADNLTLIPEDEYTDYQRL